MKYLIIILILIALFIGIDRMTEPYFKRQKEYAIRKKTIEAWKREIERYMETEEGQIDKEIGKM